MVKEMKNDFEEDRKKLKQVNNPPNPFWQKNKLGQRASAILQVISLFVSLGLGQFNSKMIQQDFQTEAEIIFYLLIFSFIY